MILKAHSLVNERPVDLNKGAVNFTSHLYRANKMTHQPVNPSFSDIFSEESVRWDDVQVIKNAIANGSTDPDGQKLHEAARKGKSEIVDLWLPCSNSEVFGQALREAAYRGHLDVIKILAPKCSEREKSEALIEASSGGHLDVVKEILTHPPVDPKMKNSEALQKASGYKHQDVFDELYGVSDPSEALNDMENSESSEYSQEEMEMLKRRIEQEKLKEQLRDAVDGKGGSSGKKKM